MKAKELMIGDWMSWVHKIESFAHPVRDFFQVYELGPDFCRYHSPYGDEVEVPTKDFEPIPLIEEILEKNGFEKSEMYFYYKLDEQSYLEYYPHEKRLTKHWVGIDEWENHSKVDEITFKCYCCYVHELQHALRLCGLDELADNFKIE